MIIEYFMEICLLKFLLDQIEMHEDMNKKFDINGNRFVRIKCSTTEFWN